MAKSDLAAAIEQICDEKNIPYESVIESIEAALAVAYRKEYGNKLLNCRVEFNPEDGSSRIFDVKSVVADPTPEELEQVAAEEALAAAQKRERRDFKKKTAEVLTPIVTAVDASAAATSPEEEKKHFNPKTDLALTDAEKIKPDAEIGDEIIKELPTPEGYGRVAAQTAKQVIIQKLREAERETLYTQYKDRVGEVVNATVQRLEGRLVYMDLGQATAIMPPAHQVQHETYTIGSRYKVYLLSVEKTNKGPEIIASRTAPEMVKALFAMEVPEIGSGSIEIVSVAREAGSRSKVAVKSLVNNIDPIGSCVGQRGARVQTVMNELGGEKIDIIEYSDDAVKFIVNALSPAKVISVSLNEKEKVAAAFVAPEHLSLAIGKGGQNVRLAARLAGWKIDVKSDEETAPKEVAKQKEVPVSEPAEKAEASASEVDGVTKSARGVAETASQPQSAEQPENKKE